MPPRSDFPQLEHDSSIYLDSAATTLKPKCVIEAISQFYSTSYATVHRGVYEKAREATKKYEQVREETKRFFNASSSEEIVFTKGTTASLNLVAASFVQKGDLVAISPFEHHSNIVPWQLKGCELKIIPVDSSGDIDLDAFEKMLQQNKIKLVSIAHISNVLGTIHPIKEITHLAHKYGAYVCVDGAQSAGHIRVNFTDLDIDFFALSSHKMYGPTGFGILYGKKELLEKMPPVEGGGDMIEKVTLSKTTFAPPPFRFEAGTPMISGAIGFHAALKFLTPYLPTSFHHEERLTSYALEQLGQFPQITILGSPKKRGGIISFTIKGSHPLDIATLLDCKKIALRSGHHCSQPTLAHFNLDSCLRISFGMYNTLQEIDYFTEALRQSI